MCRLMRAFEKYDRGVAQLVRHSAIALIKGSATPKVGHSFRKVQRVPFGHMRAMRAPNEKQLGKQVFS